MCEIKQKLEELQRENEKLEQKFWIEFYDLIHSLKKNCNTEKESNIDCNKGN